MIPRMDHRNRRLAILLLCILLGWASRSAASPEEAERLYRRARQEFSGAQAARETESRVQRFRRCIELFQQVIQEDSERKIIDKSLFMIARSYHNIYDGNHSPGDFKSAVNYYRMVTQNYPSSSLADDAQYLIGALYTRDDPSQAYIELSKVAIFFPKGDMRARADAKKAELAKSLKSRDRSKPGPQPPTAALSPEDAPVNPRSAPPGVESAGALPSSTRVGSEARGKRSQKEGHSSSKHLKKIQHWSGKDYTRVVLYTNAPVSFEHHGIPGSPKKRETGKILLDLKDCDVSRKVGANIRVMDAFLQRIRLSPREGGGTRVTLESGSIERYRAFSLEDPPRLIVDVKGNNVLETPSVPPRTRAKTARGKASREKASRTEPSKVESASPTGAVKESLARQLGLGVKRIVLDPGHGGKDKGASSPNGIHEKDITLALARELQKVLQAETGCEVLLTRNRDRYLSLEERTAIGNARKADLFISIHTNAHQDSSIGGIETYFLNFSKDKESARVAAMENATSTRKISDLETIIRDLMLNTKIKESSQLAAMVQSRTVRGIRTRYDGLRNLGTKQAPFYVLVGAEMPAILIETAFITNPKEEKLLKDKQFRHNLAKAIASGIKSYIKQGKSFASAGERS